MRGHRGKEHHVLVGRQKRVQGKPRKSLAWGLRGKGKARSAAQDQLVGVILWGPWPIGVVLVVWYLSSVISGRGEGGLLCA